MQNKAIQQVRASSTRETSPAGTFSVLSAKRFSERHKRRPQSRANPASSLWKTDCEGIIRQPQASVCAQTHNWETESYLHRCHSRAGPLRPPA